MPKIVATYDYVDKRGNLLYQKLRYKPKRFVQRRPDGNGDYIYDLNGLKPVLYRLPELLESANGEYIFITEGEKDTDRLRDEDLTATTSGSAQSWRDEFAKLLRNRKVVILPDNDAAGVNYARDVKKSLRNAGIETKVIRLPGLQDGEDISDWLNNNGGGKKRLLKLVEKTPSRKSKEKAGKGIKRIIKNRRVKRSTGEKIYKGERNVKLISQAGKLRARGLELDDLETRLLQYNERHCKPPLDEKEVGLIAESACRYDNSHFNLTDSGNGERLAKRHGDKLHYCWTWKKWLYYDGKRWNLETGEQNANRLALETARSIPQEAEGVEDHKLYGQILSWAKDSDSRTRLIKMLEAARSIEPIGVYPKDFDTDFWLLNCLNGTVDLRTGELRPHNPNDMLTRLCSVEFDPDAKSQRWNKFLKTITDGDDSLVEFLQIAAGYSACGSTAEEKLFFIHGDAATGKSTFLEAVKAALGDYAQTSDFETFIKRNQVGGIRNDVAKLNGSRLVVSIEVDEGKKLAEGLVKMLTGGDTVSARFLYQESFNFLPQFKLWLAANHPPRIKDNDSAIWRRILRIPFNHMIPKDKQNPKVKAKLRNPEIAGSAILAWLVKGCLMWQERGLLIPKVIERSTKEYRDAQNPLKDFFDECCKFSPKASVPVSTLRASYNEWAEENKERFTLGRAEFNKRLADKDCSQRTRKYKNELGEKTAARCWDGVKLRRGKNSSGNGLGVKMREKQRSKKIKCVKNQ